MRIGKYLGFAVGLAFLALMVYIAQPKEVLKVLVNANVLLLVLAFVAFIPTTIIQAMRWEYLINQKAHFRIIFKALCIGKMANNILPSKMGAVIRAAILSRKSKVRLGSSAASVFLDNIVEISFILVSCFAVSFFAVSGIEKIQGIIVSGIIGFVTLLVLALALYSFIRSKMVTKLLRKIQFIKKYGSSILSDFREYIKWISVKNMISSYFLTALFWLNTSLASYLVILSLGQEATPAIIYLASTLPFVVGIVALVPGGYGVQDASMAGILYVGGIGFAAAASIALIARLIYIFWVAVFGMASMGNMGVLSASWHK